VSAFLSIPDIYVCFTTLKKNERNREKKEGYSECKKKISQLLCIIKEG
jgi:hypothetical protein